MYSNSSAYLGGGNTSRAGQPQYGQQSFSNRLGPQSTDFGNTPIQQQYTGYPSHNQQQSFQSQPQQQPQYTGLLQQNQQPPRQQPFQTGQAAQAQLPQKTGQTSSQIAQSFQGASAPSAPAAPPIATGTKIPKIRLSFLTAQDQAKFEQLFKSAVGDGQALDGTRMKKIYTRHRADAVLQERR